MATNPLVEQIREMSREDLIKMCLGTIGIALRMDGNLRVAAEEAIKDLGVCYFPEEVGFAAEKLIEEEERLEQIEIERN